jgi:sec-independent protein translocase protein TatA
MNILLLFNFLGPEMIVIFFAILLLFGGKKIPELMRGIGKGINEFNSARNSLETELKAGIKDDERARQQAKQQANLETKQED